MSLSDSPMSREDLINRANNFNRDNVALRGAAGNLLEAINVYLTGEVDGDTALRVAMGRASAVLGRT